MIHRAALWLPVAAFMLLLFSFSGQSEPVFHPGRWDKPAHGAAYMILSLLSLRATHGSMLRVPRPAPSVVGVLIASGYGVFDEVRQSFVPGREASVGDWIADSIGALAAVALMAALARLPLARRGRGHERG